MVILFSVIAAIVFISCWIYLGTARFFAILITVLAALSLGLWLMFSGSIWWGLLVLGIGCVVIGIIYKGKELEDPGLRDAGTYEEMMENHRLRDAGTYEEMMENPDLNTQDTELHFKRLERYGYSRFLGDKEYMGPRGGIYTINSSGNKQYR